ncbi:unnamed protein product [Zymoseptoria tritici ST99CH_1E4]|uniref:Apple domain-containing protein n=1 Tax=Zymoseptoria tritici ST99CH_1E4 TaxID=1276532 RepID=A0A2H1H4J5_ZYMTR|nr:unnamed protein product [Zymoseptoria tritici ST99CH_1E4]
MRFFSVLTAVLPAGPVVDAAILPDLDSRSPLIHDINLPKRQTQRCGVAGTDRTNCRPLQTIASCNAARASTLCKQNTRCKSYAVTTASNGVQSCGLYAFTVSQDEHDDFETGDYNDETGYYDDETDYYNDEADYYYNSTGKQHKSADKHYYRATEYHSEPYKQHDCKIKHYFAEIGHYHKIQYLHCETRCGHDKRKHLHSKTQLDHDEIKLDEHRDSSPTTRPASISINTRSVPTTTTRSIPTTTKLSTATTVSSTATTSVSNPGPEVFRAECFQLQQRSAGQRCSI